MLYSTRRFILCLTLCHFVLVFYSPFSIAITSLGEERANLSAFRTFIRFVLVWICRFPLPLGVWEGLRFVIVALLDFSLTFFQKMTAILHFRSKRLKLFLIYKSSRYLLPTFKQICKTLANKKRFNFSCSFYKFRVDRHFGSGDVGKNRFSRSWICWCTSCPETSNQISSQLAFCFRRRSAK